MAVLCSFAQAARAGDVQSSPPSQVLTTVTEVGKGEETPTLTGMAVAETLRDENEKLRRENRRLEEENQVLQKQLVEMESLRNAPVSRKDPMPVKMPVKTPEKIQPRADFLKDLLEASHVVPQEAIAEGSEKRNYHWQSDDSIYGSALMIAWPKKKAFKDAAADYLHQSASRCHGDYAQKMENVAKVGMRSVLEGEMTCLDGQNSAAAAVLFIADGDEIAAVIHEGTADELQISLSKRDLIKEAISEVK